MKTILNKLTVVSTVLICAASLTIACSKKIQKYTTVVSQTREVAIFPIGAAEGTTSVEAIRRSVVELYDCRVSVLPGEATLKQEIPVQAIQQAAMQRADDLILLIYPVANVPGESQTLRVRMLRMQDMQESLAFELPMDDLLVDVFKENLAKGVPDLGVNPKGDALKAAGYLEKKGFLAQALAVYQFIWQQKTGNLFLHEINARDELDRKIKELQNAVEKQDLQQQDQLAVYGLQLEYGNVSRRYQDVFKNLVAEMKLMEFLARYTTKPTTLSISFNDDKTSSLLLTLRIRFHKDWYWQSVKELPSLYDGQRLLHFTPYFGIMNKLVDLKNRFLVELQNLQVQLPEQVDTSLVLVKLLGDEMHVPVVQNKEGKLLFPYNLLVRVQGYEQTTITPGNKAAYDRYGHFVIGPANLLSGQRTQWGLLYDFFNIPTDSLSMDPILK